ncbi:hypothetical protein [Micromonospora sp. WMMD980]|uniref:hypothetical protein n=1 Tax=Micromonospora sp. WMMD980 TaxID=3016088 RepID=UPI00241810CE|nr:hypothetical protein [Micromonospora sp. WMMD980]MDG4799052.1 hypothetical protein [Micromonospora sp. WMMD980]
MPKILIDLHVELEDGATHEVVADQRDVAKWEIQDFGCPFDAIGDRPHLALRWLAWSVMSRRSLTALSWLDFDAVCVEVSDSGDGDDVDIEVAEPDPGRPAPSEETSSSSPGAPGSH